MGVVLRQKNDDGKWWIFINHNKKRSSKCLGLITEEKARKKYREIQADLAANNFIRVKGALRTKTYEVFTLKLSVPLASQLRQWANDRADGDVSLLIRDLMTAEAAREYDKLSHDCSPFEIAKE